MKHASNLLQECVTTFQQQQIRLLRRRMSSGHFDVNDAGQDKETRHKRRKRTCDPLRALSVRISDRQVATMIRIECL